MPVERCGPLAAWTSAWIAGGVSLDEVIDAVTGSDGAHQVQGLAIGDDPGADPVPLRELLVAWRRGGGVRVVLPVAGDVRGLPGPAAFRADALEVGEAVVGGSFAGTAIGATPQLITYAPSSAPPTVVWHAAATDPVPADPVVLGEAQYDLTTAIRESATALARADVAGRAEGIAGTLRSARRAGEVLNLPPGFPQDAVALLAQAERMQAVLDLALADPVGGAVDRVGIDARTQALRPLVTAVRRARLAAYNAGHDAD